MRGPEPGEMKLGIYTLTRAGIATADLLGSHHEEDALQSLAVTQKHRWEEAIIIGDLQHNEGRIFGRVVRTIG
jgi:hypothetical protein